MTARVKKKKKGRKKDVTLKPSIRTVRADKKKGRKRDVMLRPSIVTARVDKKKGRKREEMLRRLGTTGSRYYYFLHHRN